MAKKRISWKVFIIAFKNVAGGELFGVAKLDIGSIIYDNHEVRKINRL